MVANNNGHFLLHHDHQIDEVTNYFLFNGESFTNATKSSLLFPSLGNIIQFPRKDLSRHFNIEGPINGLYCLHNEEGGVVIWNPVTIEVGLLPSALECVPADTVDRVGLKANITELAAELRVPVKNTHVYAFAEHGNDLGSSKNVKGNPTEVYKRVGHGSSYGVGVKLGQVRAEYAVDHNSGVGAVFFRFGERF